MSYDTLVPFHDLGLAALVSRWVVVSKGLVVDAQVELLHVVARRLGRKSLCDSVPFSLVLGCALRLFARATGRDGNMFTTKCLQQRRPVALLDELLAVAFIFKTLALV